MLQLAGHIFGPQGQPGVRPRRSRHAREGEGSGGVWPAGRVDAASRLTKHHCAVARGVAQCGERHGADQILCGTRRTHTGRVRNVVGESSLRREACRAQVDRYQGSRYKAFPTRAEAEAFVHGADPAGAAERAPPAQSTVTHAVPRKRKAEAEAMSVKAPRAFPEGLTVYTDGSSRGNGQRGATAGYGVYWDDPQHHHLNLSCRLKGVPQTNNRAELTAILRAIQLCPEPEKPLRIFTDSQYAMHAVTKWIPGWQRNGWKTSTGSDVLNKDLMVALHDAFALRAVRPSLEYVRAHVGTHGNEMADRYAPCILHPD